MATKIIRREPLGFPWAGTDPFILCTHHLEAYPPASAGQGIAPELLRDRPIGNDFSGKDGFNMYYGTSVPGFPAHPHRGFETVTIALRGLIDHTDSMGAAARYGEGDVQWLTTGSGILHCEMFPLRDADEGNLLEFYQIWLNLPSRSKMSAPAFKMLWDSQTPTYRQTATNGAHAEVRIIAGMYSPVDGHSPPLIPASPAPESWAADPANDVAIWDISLEPGTAIVLPPAVAGAARRTLYYHMGDGLRVESEEQPEKHLIEVVARSTLRLENGGGGTVRCILLQGVPIGEPVVAHGPFVMTTYAEIERANQDFRTTQFGGWPWDERGPVHAPSESRFARYPDSTEPEFPPN